jgi:hypothetical protein
VTVLRRSSTLFLGSALLVATACALVVRSHAFAVNPDVAAWGVTFDLTLTIPALYWLFVVRRGKAHALTIAPVFIIGTLLASLVVPRGNQQFLHSLERSVGPIAEILLLGALGYRLYRYRHDARAETDMYERIRVAARAALPMERVADAVASELAMTYYAFFCWRKKADRNDEALTFHTRGGWGTIVICILVLIAAEGAAAHLLLASWSVKAAWIWTALDLWAAIWLIGDYQALRLRRTTIAQGVLHLRYGLRWSADIPLEDIEAVDALDQNAYWKRPGVLKVAMIEDPRWMVTLKRPIVVHGLAGLRKTVSAIALLPDQDVDLSAALLASAATPKS